MPKVYLDMDGVLADFDKALVENNIPLYRDSRLLKQNIDKSQWTQDEKERDLRVQELMSRPGFFRNLSFMEGADRLWITAGKPIVLTARPKKIDTANRVRDEKREWITDYFGEVPEDRFICCLRSEKANYALGNILVDDLEWNCSEWIKAGGDAIHFKNMDQAISDLKRMLNTGTHFDVV